MKKVFRRAFTFMTSLAILCSGSSVWADSDADFIFDQITLGDVDDDNMISVSDAGCMCRYMTGQNEIDLSNADVNHDEKVNIVDYVMLKNCCYEMKNEPSPFIDSVSSGDESSRLEYKFRRSIYDENEYTFIFDEDEQIVYNKLNEFISSYGMRKNKLYYLGGWYADEIARKAVINNQDLQTVINKNQISTLVAIEYTNLNNITPDKMVEIVLMSDLYKAILLNKTLNLAVGHYENYWVILKIF